MTINQGKLTKRMIQETGYRFYRIVLKPDCFFELKPREKPVHFAVRRTPRANHRIEERMIGGTYRRVRDLQENYISLEIIHDLDAIIPYDTIDIYERLSIDPF